MASTADEDASLDWIQGQFHDLPDLWDPGEDWTGITSTAQRKKLQNRLNQRAYRRRQKYRAVTSSDPRPDTAAVFPNKSYKSPAAGSEVSTRRRPDVTTNNNAHFTAAAVLSLFISEDELARSRNFIRRAYEEYTLNAPRPEALPLLIRINVLNAIATNARRLGIPTEGLCRDDLISPFNLLGPRPPIEPFWSSAHCPAALQPTSLQKTIVHHPWIDLLPFAALRDNLLKFLALGLLDDDELCFDILEITDGDLTAKPAMIVWGDASDGSSWEVNSAFLRKWGFLIKDCPQIIEATNHWRESRGEKRIIYEL
ncbi:hypothetical protein V1509DRAFT_613118 [Lipomyces kononenkoae]